MGEACADLTAPIHQTLVSLLKMGASCAAPSTLLGQHAEDLVGTVGLNVTVIRPREGAHP
jgi:hypothetical protein